MTASKQRELADDECATSSSPDLAGHRIRRPPRYPGIEGEERDGYFFWRGTWRRM